MKKLVKKFPILQSSADPKKLSMTIKGVVTGIIFFLSLSGIIPADAMKEAGNITNVLVSGVQGLLVGIGAVWTTYGALRKLYYKWFNVK